MVVEVLLLLVVLLLCVASYFTGPPPGLPPGRWGIPFIGSLPKYSVSIKQHIENLRKEFGDIFHVKMGSRVYVILSEFNLVKTVFADPVFAGRPDFFTWGLYRDFKNTGLLFSEGSNWHNARRFSLRHLRDFGMGKSSMDDSVQEEAGYLIKNLEAKCGSPVELDSSLDCAVLNVLWQLVGGRRYELNNEKMKVQLKAANEDTEDIQGAIMMLDMFPGLIPFIPRFIKDKVMNLCRLERNYKIMHEFNMEIIREHQSTLDSENPRDYIDTFLIEMNKQQDDQNTIYNLDNLVICLEDMFMAGSETTSSTLRWFVLFMALNMHIQEKVQSIIDDVVPQDRLPSMHDRESLQYLEAVIHEVHRKCSLVVFGGYHNTSQTSKINGYKIPKGTVIMQNTHAIHNDPRYWEKPDEFYPEHFIDEKGRCLTKKDGFLPFSIGRRACLGESVARLSLLVFAAALLQKFKISVPDGDKLTIEMSEDFFLNRTKPYKVTLTKRY